jgi:hypothetical protein
MKHIDSWNSFEVLTDQNPWSACYITDAEKKIF